MSTLCAFSFLAFYVTFIVIIWIPLFLDASRRCLECQHTASPRDCQFVSTCGPHEDCFIEQYVTNDGIVLYDTGCKDKQICTVHSAFGKRYDEKFRKRDDTVVCDTCCEPLPGTLCNIQGCGQKATVLPAGSKFCYNCVSAKAPDVCPTFTVCDKAQSCGLKEITNLLGEKRYQMGCIDKLSCPTSASQSSCEICCDTDFCNENCNATSTPITAKPTTSTQTTTKANRRTTTAAPPQTTTVLTTIQTTPSTQPTTSAGTSPKVLSPVVTEVHRTPHNIHLGDTVVLSCKATGYPDPSYTFKFRDGSLPINAQTKDNILTLTNFDVTNIGRYECIAFNSEGTGYYGVYLSL